LKRRAAGIPCIDATKTIERQTRQVAASWSKKIYEQF
jgi:hypothetical protein